MSTIHSAPWHKLGTSTAELRLKFTLPTGQSFRWKETGDEEYTGVIGDRVVQARQEPGDVAYRVIARGPDAKPEDDERAVIDYFNLGIELTHKAAGWAAADARFAAIAPHIHGCRVLRQPPVECLFSFICSSNNHISRIHGMVERLCTRYGTQLGATASAGTDGGMLSPSTAYYAFPTIAQLQAATEDELRAAGFGYRAKYVVGTAAMLAAQPEGGGAWLLALRTATFDQCVEQLCQLPGVGPKVAACISLFACDQHAAIPVDTHVWALACKYYTPHLKQKTLTPKLHPIIMQAFVDVFGEYAGWAHNALFISELASQQKHLPPTVGAAPKAKLKAVKRARSELSKAQSTSPQQLASVPLNSDDGPEITDAQPGLLIVKDEASGTAAASSPSSSPFRTAFAAPLSTPVKVERGGRALEKDKRSSAVGLHPQGPLVTPLKSDSENDGCNSLVSECTGAAAAHSGASDTPASRAEATPISRRLLLDEDKDDPNSATPAKRMSRLRRSVQAQ